MINIYLISDELNEKKLEALSGKGKLYQALDRGADQFVESLKHCKAEKELKLKIGAQVILLTNLEVKRGLGSGSQVFSLF
jgi:hypothetical protein